MQERPNAYFSEVLNRDDPMNPVEEDEIEELEEPEEIDLGRWRECVGEYKTRESGWTRQSRHRPTASCHGRHCK